MEWIDLKVNRRYKLFIKFPAKKSKWELQNIDHVQAPKSAIKINKSCQAPETKISTLDLFWQSTRV